MDEVKIDQKGLSDIRMYKGLDHLNESEEMKVFLEDEFPHRKSMPLNMDRRSVLKMMGGAAALAGMTLTGCRYQPQRKIVPFARQPEGASAGAEKHYATMFSLGGYAMGVLARQMDGRPVFLEGNPLHPASQGSIDAKANASVLGVYDPDRLKYPQFRSDTANWNEAYESIRKELKDSVDGSGVAILSDTVGSPTLARVAGEFMKKYPKAQWFQYEAVNRDNVHRGASLAFQQNASFYYSLDKADVLVNLDCDLLMSGPASVRYSRDFANRRNPEGNMSRVYSFEAFPTTVGAASDHRVPVKPSEVKGILLALCAQVGVPGAASVSLPASVPKNVFDAMASDLINAGANGLVTVGDHHDPEVHAAALALNQHLGAFGTTVTVTNPILPMHSDHGTDLANLTAAMANNQVRMLIILNTNPVYETPADIDFAELLTRVPTKVRLGLYHDETSKECDWQLPASHFLETWNDGFAFDGTYTLGQPLLEPLYDSRSAMELMAAFTDVETSGEDLVRKTTANAGVTATDWKVRLSEGVGTSAAPAQNLAVTEGLLSLIRPAAGGNGMELMILPDPYIHDGRFGNNNWLQELPRPLTNIVWDNALFVSRATADKLGIVPPGEQKTFAGTPYYGAADMAKVTVGDRTLEVPVWINLGQADDVCVLHLGYGRDTGGEFAKIHKLGYIGSEVTAGGFNAYELRTSQSPDIISGVSVEKIKNKSYAIATTQHHNTIDVSIVDNGRDLIHEMTLASLAASHGGDHAEGEHGGEHGEGTHGAVLHDTEFGEHGNTKEDMSFYTGEDFKDNPKDNYQWAMTIDLSLCTGCNACTSACQAENNIPTVQKQEVMRGREMHWIRVDRYYKGTGESLDTNNPPIRFQPVACQQCEQAPCEPVCPVAATVHSHEGINQMVYNRCVGTRYCSNNCPYKVRRFNFFHYSQRADQVPVIRMLQNPDVTVRFRGVMEKCTFCIQRIKHARVAAKKDGRMIEDGEVRTACQNACPSQAIILGDKRDPKNMVSISRANKRNYLLLEELNTRPRTTYLARVSNPNPTLEGK
ncbi:MAG: Fe-S-cluster-containing hydrogenase [Fimbriimonadaceae bacterium]